MAEFTAVDSYFDFDKASENDVANDVALEEPKALRKFFKYPESLNDQRPEPHSAMRSEFIQQADQTPAISDPSPAMAPLPALEMHQQWPTLAPTSQYMGTSHFTYGASTAPNQQILQQQEARHPPNVQQQQPILAHTSQYTSQYTSTSHFTYGEPTAPYQQILPQQREARSQPNIPQLQPIPAPTSQSRDPIHNTNKQPPSCCILHTKMYAERFGPCPSAEDVAPHPSTHQQPFASAPRTNQHQPAHTPLNLLDPKLRPSHLLQPPHPHSQNRQPFPAGLAPKPTLEPPAAIQQQQRHQPTNQPLPLTPHQPLPLTPHQQQQQPHHPPHRTQQTRASPFHNPPPRPKGSKPAGITKPKPAPKPKQLGRPPKEPAPPPTAATGWVNATVPPEHHVNTTMYGRNSLRGPGAAARLAQPWNRPEAKERGKGGEEGGLPGAQD